MALFKTIKIHLATCLYFPNETHIFNVKRLLATIAAFLVVVLYFAFLFYEADTVTEYVSSAYMTVATLGIFMSLIDTTFKTKTIFALIDNDLRKICRKSSYRSMGAPCFYSCRSNRNSRMKTSDLFSELICTASKPLYMKTHRIVEKFSKIMKFVIVDVTVPGFIIPKAIFSFYVYFTTDLGADAFELPVPTW